MFNNSTKTCLFLPNFSTEFHHLLVYSNIKFCLLTPTNSGVKKQKSIKCSRISWIEPALIISRIFSNRKNPETLSRESKNQQIKSNNLAQPTRPTTGLTCRSTNLQLQTRFDLFRSHQCRLGWARLLNLTC